MNTPHSIRRLLAIAKFTFPGLEWRVTSDGRVFASDTGQYFNLNDKRCDSVWRLKLYQVTGYRISQRPDGMWIARKKDGWAGPNESLEILIYQCLPNSVGVSDERD